MSTKEEAKRVIDVTDEFIDTVAIEIAQGNNGGTWETHYTEKQREYWRNFARRLVQDIATRLKK